MYILLIYPKAKKYLADIILYYSAASVNPVALTSVTDWPKRLDFSGAETDLCQGLDIIENIKLLEEIYDSLSFLELKK